MPLSLTFSMESMRQCLKTFNKGTNDNLMNPWESYLYEFVACVVRFNMWLSWVGGMQLRHRVKIVCALSVLEDQVHLLKYFGFFSWEHVPPMTACRTLGAGMFLILVGFFSPIQVIICLLEHTLIYATPKSPIIRLGEPSFGLPTNW